MVLSHTYTNRASIFINADAVTNMQDKANMDFRRMTNAASALWKAETRSGHGNSETNKNEIK